MSQLYKLREALQSPETCATTAGIILLQKYGPEAIDWDLSTIAMELRDDFGDAPCQQVMDRIGAFCTLMSSDAFFSRVDAFQAICSAYGAGEPMFETFSPLATVDIEWTVLEAALDRDLMNFGPYLKEYAELIVQNDGLERTPKVIECMLDDKEDDLKHIASTLSASDDPELEDLKDKYTVLRHQLLELFGTDNVEQLLSEHHKLKNLPA